MLKNFYFFIFLFFLIVSNADILDNKNQDFPEKTKILAKNIETKDNITIAKGNVLIHSPVYYITAKKAIFDKNKSTLELFDDVNIIKNGESTTFSDYVFLDLKNEIDTFVPILLIDDISKIWINSKKADKKNDLIKFKTSTLSSCDCNDPAWTISFTSGDHNTTKQWLNTYNTTLFIKDVPIVYTPYFGFSSNNTRRTGLLRPTIGYSNTEGFLYAQPIYYAPKLNWDIEYIPQIRTTRGKGHQLNFRIKDSAVSSLEFEAGSFKENKTYFNKSNLRNQKHNGWDLKYERSKVVSKKQKNEQDGLLVSLHGLNDIDYVNTKYDNESTSGDKLLESKIKYFYNKNDFYGDVDFKYYKDTSKTNNDDTMQELPKIHLHKYSSQTFFNNLLYSVDSTYSNKTRTAGLKAKTANIFVPLTYSFKILDDYLNILFSEQINLIDIKYGNNVNNYSDGQFLENKHIVSLSTDLLKPYKDYIHTVNLKASLTVPNIIKQDGDLYSVTNNESDLSVFPVTKTQKNISFTLNQSIYNKEEVSKIINHKINQSIIYRDNGASRLSDLENELIFYYKYGTLSNRILFNHQADIIMSSSSSLSFAKDDFSSNVYYAYSKKTSSISSTSESYSYKDLPYSENLTLDLSYKFYKYYRLMFKEEYNLVTNIANKKEYILDINKKCWGFNIKLADNLVASATTNNSALRQKIFYIQLILKPIATLNQKYTQKAKEE